MRHIKLFQPFLNESELSSQVQFGDIINETLKSDKVDIVVKKLDNFFTKKGLNKRPITGNPDTESPYYQIITDRRRYKEGLTDHLKLLKNTVNDPTTSPKSKSFYMNQIPDLEKQLSEFSYDDYETIVINTDFNSKELSLELISLINSIGYHIVSVGTWGTYYQNHANLYDPVKTLMSKDKIKLLAIQPNYGERVEFNGEYVYHTTDSKYLDKILKYGLVPKSKNSRFFYPGRIFLSPSKQFSDTIKDNRITHELERSKIRYAEREKLRVQKEKEWVDLRIKNFAGLTLYRDMMAPPNDYSWDENSHKGGFFTYDNIPPKYIEVIPRNSDHIPDQAPSIRSSA
jgi:hypothetical protein